jgi:hypothetical protein
MLLMRELAQSFRTAICTTMLMVVLTFFAFHHASAMLQCPCGLVH